MTWRLPQRTSSRAPFASPVYVIRVFAQRLANAGGARCGAGASPAFAGNLRADTSHRRSVRSLGVSLCGADAGRGIIAPHVQKGLLSIGDDYNIENDRCERTVHVDCKALRVRNTLLFKDSQGHELCKIPDHPGAG